MSNIIAIVGRPNVGKSTFFNRLTGTRKAIVDEQPGVTRDRHYGKGHWNGIDFSVIDTGGYVFGSEDVFEKQIRLQVEIALLEADIILFMVDVTAGITEQDEKVASLLRKYLSSKKTPLSSDNRAKREGWERSSGAGGEVKKIMLVANKTDTSEREHQSGEFYKLGMGDISCISSMTGRGTGEFLDKIVGALEQKPIETNIGIPKIAIVGRPNAGKSSLLNALLGEERAIVTPVAGTTRDALHTHYKKYDHEFILIDTAGIRKKRKYEEVVEFYSNLRAIRAIEECDVCLIMLDARLGMEAQDVNIFRLAERNKKGVVILVNKWDLVKKETATAKEVEEKIKHKMAPFRDVPVLFISALNKQRIMKVVEEAEKVYQKRKKRISDEELKEFIIPVVQAHSPSSEKGNLVDISSMIQIPANTPVFAIHVNLPKAIKESYKRFLENQLREKFDFCGVPLQIHFRKS
ncbi:MAG: ribosome biogenesis GTPase Der [Bacteroidetes bacterium]|nr:ribosome biogenesis GTPase Der [Bacteroidota bacterium]